MSEAKNKLLVPCRTCGAEVSRKASTCPKCGEKKPYARKNWRRLVINLVILITTIYTFSSLISWLEEGKIDNPTPVAQDNTQTRLRHRCQDAIIKSANHPSTVDMHGVFDQAYIPDESGDKLFIQGFSAKNSFGVELTYKARCVLKADGRFLIDISEE